jgi:CubicO group peptidase (beta-lactamase class C family)
VAWAKSAFGLDRPLVSFLDEVRGTPSEGVPMDLFLAHRAGLVDYIPLYVPLLAGGRAERATAIVSCARARRHDAAGEPPQGGFAPVYSDPNYILAGEALARASAVADAGAAMERWVTEALGIHRGLATAGALSRTHAHWPDCVAPTETVEWRGGQVRGVVHDENAWALTGDGSSGHAGLFGNVQSVLQFGCAVLDGLCLHEGPLAGADLLPLVRPRPGGSLLAGFDAKSASASSAGARMGHRAFGHLGFTGTSLWLDPDVGIVIVLLTNRVCPSRDNVTIRAARPGLHDQLVECALRLG